MFKRILLIFLLALILSAPCRQSFAYRPLGTEDAGVAGKGVFQTELSWDYLTWKDEKENVFLFVPIYGLTEKLELSVEIPYMFHQPKEEAHHRGVGDINIVGKYLIIPEGESNPAFTVKGAIKMKNGDFGKGLGSGDEDYSIFGITSKSFGALTVHAHLGYTWVGKEKDENLRNIYLYGLALDYGITDAFHIVGEINGNRHPDRIENEDPRVALLGATYKLSEKLTADFGVRKGLTSTAPDWSTTMGVSITF